MPVHHQVLFTQYQVHLILARAGLKNLRNALDLKKFLCTEISLGIQRAIQEMKTETLNACWKKLWPEAVRNPTGGSLDEIHHSAIDTAVNRAK